MRVTIACPEALIDDANQLALCLGYGPGDVATDGLPIWQDADGNRYAVASGDVSPAFATAAAAPLVEPEWGADLEAAARAQAAITIGLAASPVALAAMFGEDAQAALTLLGLTRVEVDPA